MSEEAQEGVQQPQRRPSRFYAVRTLGGREIDVALMLENRAKEMGFDIRSIIVLPKVKGIVLVEAPASFIVAEAIRGIPYARSIAPGYISPEEVAKVLKGEREIRVKVGQVVEIISGPFRGTRARVERVNPEKREVEVVILDASYNLRTTLPVESVRPLREEEHGA